MANHQKVFVVDDELNIRGTIKEALEEEGYEVVCFESPVRAVGAMKEANPDLIVTDLVMPELNGLDLVRKAKTINPEVNVVVITAYASLESAVGAIRAGASDYLVKPFKIADLLGVVKKALSQKRLTPEAAIQHKGFPERYHPKNMIGATAEMKEIFRLIEKIAKTESTVLIIGESGTGKEMVARSIHYQSRRRKGPFVSINCAALPENLLESELFGYEKGAFTGAVASKMGLFELAESGTFLLDEIGEMSISLQVKLLRVLQERTLKRLGGVRDILVNFRLLAATSKNLPAEIKAGRFREDLFYRLNVIPIIMPPLRRRAQDIPLFVSYFLSFFAERHGISRTLKVTDEAIGVLQGYPWPGNIRELENVIERLVTLSEAETLDQNAVEEAIHTGNFSSASPEPINTSSDLRVALESFEKDLIEKAIRDSGGNKNRAAKKLNLTRQNLQYKINKYGISASVTSSKEKG
ncbi:MAG: sigma-54-dependent Fis family transcriptional regulator [Candidatus Omnitrophica bacterium]|nr:sigma-54-dependent Fis family transcriptional regulator [Candidatus Omnitrophota bacterium]